jgi:quercetin dioxygenase-like cupin family protein
MIRRAIRLTLGAVLIVAGTAAFVRSQPADDALDPLRVAPDTHKLAFENAYLRVLEVRIPPGKIEPRHRHPRGMSVYFTDWDVKVTIDGREPQLNHRKTGTFAWSDPVVHTVQNVGKTEGHVLRIELK